MPARVLIGRGAGGGWVVFVLEDVSVIVLGNADVALAVDEDEDKVAVASPEISVAQ